MLSNGQSYADATRAMRFWISDRFLDRLIREPSMNHRGYRDNLDFPSPSRIMPVHQLNRCTANPRPQGPR